MKVQYLGDKNDYRKYALLRRFAEAGFRIGICWVMTNKDTSRDGLFRSYLKQPGKWRRFDPEIFDALGTFPNEPTFDDLYRLEALDLISGALYFNDITPDSLTDRHHWHAKAMQKFASVDLVFFDPDNGFEVPSHPKGRALSSKYVFFDEVTDYYHAGSSILVYQHYPRKPRGEFVHDLAMRMRNMLSEADVWAFETAHVVFMLAVRPEHRSMAVNAETAIREQLKHGLMIYRSFMPK